MIKIYVLHAAIHSLDDMIRVFSLQNVDINNIIYTNNNPDILISTEWIYNSLKCRTEFLNLYNKNKLNILWCGEAIHPDFNLFDYVISYSNRYSSNERHIRMMSPFLQWKNDFNIDYLKNDCDIPQKKYFCDFIYSNSNGINKRKELFDIINTYKIVYAIGNFLNNSHITGWQGNRCGRLIDIKKDFKFSIACENAKFNGYTSEKVFTSLFAHTLPIYFGNDDIEDDVNKDAIINANKLSNNELIDIIQYYDNNDEAYNEKILSQYQTDDQIKNFKYRDQKYLEFFTNLFNGNLKKMTDYGFHENNYINSLIYNKYLI